MKTLSRIFLIVFAAAFLLSSCSKKEKCAAYSKVELEEMISE